jgi:hypothetical protein
LFFSKIVVLRLDFADDFCLSSIFFAALRDVELLEGVGELAEVHVVARAKG